MSVTTEESADAPAIRPFTIETPEADLEDLRARIAATRWPEKETVADISQGPQLATMQALARYWATEYDWPWQFIVILPGVCVRTEKGAPDLGE
jgi:hypothetical protein